MKNAVQSASTLRKGKPVGGLETRSLTFDEWAQLQSLLNQFRNEFAVWADMFPNDWELLAFVRYEEVDLPVVREVEPYILGEKCVQLYGARWCMLKSGSDWHFAINHEDFEQPVNLNAFNVKQIRHRLSRRWQKRLLDPSTND